VREVFVKNLPVAMGKDGPFFAGFRGKSWYYRTNRHREEAILQRQKNFSGLAISP
jgi:hypothetical protein